MVANVIIASTCRGAVDPDTRRPGPTSWVRSLRMMQIKRSALPSAVYSGSKGRREPT